VPQAPEADECMRYCQDMVHWNNHAVPSASDRFASQASPVLPDVFSTGTWAHSARRMSWFGAERNGRSRKGECQSEPLPVTIFCHTFFVRHPPG
jgi:hypothetical protein